MEKIQFNDPETQSQDIMLENIEQLKRLFPEAFTEGKIDYEVLKQLLGEQINSGEEKYGLNWHGKRAARRLALTTSTGTLRPCPEDSVDWDTTHNLMIEGDNLEVLKLLQKSYAGKVKMIYIDPPYNTGKDFVYEDNYQNNIRNYLEITGQIEGGKKISSNTENNGRYHTNWLNMIYPRIKIAKNLLRKDGVIFISIDDSEIGNLRTICDEIFGSENFCGVIKRRAARKTAFLSKRMTDMCDYIVAYVSSELAAPLSAGQISDGTRPVLNAGNIDSIRKLRAGSIAKCPDGDYKEGIYSASTLTFEFLNNFQIKDGIVVNEVIIKGPWRINQDILDKTLFITRNIGLRRTMLPEELNQAKLLNDLLDDKDCYNEKGSEELKSLLGEGVFSNPKPRGLIEYLAIAAGVSDTDIILDFFAGSGTTGHALLAQNSIDGGSRQFILVQLPEPLDSDIKEQKLASDFCDQLRKPRNIAELTKERLRRASKKIKDENPLFHGDLGFRVFKLDSSNIRAWEADRDNLPQTLEDAIEHLKPGRTETDILYELLLKLGLDLSVPIETKSIAGKTVYSIGNGTLMVCLSEEINPDEVEPLAQGMIAMHQSLSPAGDTTIVFRDSAFLDDVTKTNLTAILNQYGLTNIRSL